MSLPDPIWASRLQATLEFSQACIRLQMNAFFVFLFIFWSILSNRWFDRGCDFLPDKRWDTYRATQGRQEQWIQASVQNIYTYIYTYTNTYKHIHIHTNTYTHTSSDQVVAVSGCMCVCVWGHVFSSNQAGVKWKWKEKKEGRKSIIIIHTIWPNNDNNNNEQQIKEKENTK